MMCPNASVGTCAGFAHPDPRWLVTGTGWFDALVGVVAGIVLMWFALVVALLLVRPRRGLLQEALRLLPDLVREHAYPPSVAA